ncbi:MAG: hypothetical protein ACOC56_03240 [Atribacterota bacterium]
MNREMMIYELKKDLIYLLMMTGIFMSILVGGVYINDLFITLIFGFSLGFVVAITIGGFIGLNDLLKGGEE